MQSTQKLAQHYKYYPQTFKYREFKEIQQHGSLLDFVMHTIQPESELEKSIIQDEDWLKGAVWGDPRPGHPEGKVLYHIQDVLFNVEQTNVKTRLRRDLRLITIIHDTFKHKEEKRRPRLDWNKHHAVYARKFAEKFIAESYLLDIIEFHDEAYYAWCDLYRKGKKQEGTARLKRVFDRIGEEHKQLFYLFFKCDTSTGDKTQAPIKWFEKFVKDIEVIEL